MNTTAIANHLNVAEAAITEVQEWARVLWVRVKGLGARFVSKKVVEMDEGKTVAEKLEEIGGSRWTKGDHDRVYFHGSVVAKLLNLSNNKARQINAAKFYYDLNAGQFVQGCNTKCWDVTDTPGVGRNRQPYWVEVIVQASGI
jgi:hypothetical protein